MLVIQGIRRFSLLLILLKYFSYINLCFAYYTILRNTKGIVSGRKRYLCPLIKNGTKLEANIEAIEKTVDLDIFSRDFFFIILQGHTKIRPSVCPCINEQKLPK